jgi:phosphoglycolate phosphatase
VRRRYDQLVFDLDGTLIDSRADLAGAINRVRARLVLDPLPPPKVWAYVGEGARRLVQRSLADAADVDVGEALRLFLDEYGQHLLDHTRAYPGVPEVLGVLQSAGVVLSVLTNKPEEPSRRILAGLDLAVYFAAVVGEDSLALGKPDPGGLQHLAALAGTEIDRLLLVGDSPIDARTALAAQAQFCGVLWGPDAEPLRRCGVTLLVERPEEILRCVLGGQ